MEHGCQKQKGQGDDHCCDDGGEWRFGPCLVIDCGPGKAPGRRVGLENGPDHVAESQGDELLVGDDFVVFMSYLYAFGY